VLLFGGLILSYHRTLLLQSHKLLLYMEELGTVPAERKNFFSHMAHNLKAPIAAVHGFIGLIRESNLYLDEELQTYIRLIEDENTEMSQRVQSLSKLNAFDRITTPRVVMDVDELLILFENLIYNAFPTQPPAEPSKSPPRLVGESVVIAVSDTGYDISTEHLPHVFEQFYTTRSQTSQGSGMGLYICKLTVDELGGSIAVKSELSKGTSFTVYLPLSP
ncbi:MAG: HAMP domain-containing sensor histidine kinase, partial [Oscillospiraceae bacterium]